MPRTVATLPAGSRITDHISLGVIARFFPLPRIHEVLQKSDRASIRERDLPAHVVVYYVIALALYMRSSYREVLRCLLEGIQWLRRPSAPLKVAGNSGISQARRRLGFEPVQALYESVVAPLADSRTKRGRYRRWKLVTLAGSTFDMAETAANEKAFGRPDAGRGSSACPRIRFVALLEHGTHVLWAARMDKYDSDEIALAAEVVPALRKGMLCLADQYSAAHQVWRKAAQTGAELLWRVRHNDPMAVDQCLADGSYLSRTYPSTPNRRNRRNQTVVRVIEYRLEDVPGAESSYRLITTILNSNLAPARELAALFHERGNIDTSLDEFKTHLRGARIVLRSRTPELVRQEFYGLLMAHFAIRRLIYEAALRPGEDPNCLSLLPAVRLVPVCISRPGAMPPFAEQRFS